MALAETSSQHQESTPSRGAVRRWWRRKPIKRSVIWTHRWLALVAGLVLLIITTTGVPLLYDEEISRAQHPEAYQPHGAATLSLGEALPFVHRHAPGFEVQSFLASNGVYTAENFDTGERITVDPSNGAILGDYNSNTDSGVLPWTMSLFRNIHMCALSCEEYVGYQSWLNDSIPLTGWLGFDGEPITYAGLILGVTGVLLLFLAVSGIWLWWPGVRRWMVGLRVRLRGGRYARDYDLHQVVGMVAVPLLLLWALTGMSFEFGWVEKAWYGATPGSPVENSLVSKKSKQPDISADDAIAIAQRKAGTDEAPTALDLPAADDPTATYGVWFADGFDAWRHMEYPGDLLVSVDRHGDAAKVTYGGDESAAQVVYEQFNFQSHAGYIVGPWWRSVWVVIGLTPLLLAFTGVSTWLYKRRLRKRRRQSLATA